MARSNAVYLILAVVLGASLPVEAFTFSCEARAYDCKFYTIFALRNTLHTDINKLKEYMDLCDSCRKQCRGSERNTCFNHWTILQNSIDIDCRVLNEACMGGISWGCRKCKLRCRWEWLTKLNGKQIRTYRHKTECEK